MQKKGEVGLGQRWLLDMTCSIWSDLHFSREARNVDFYVKFPEFNVGKQFKIL